MESSPRIRASLRALLAPRRSLPIGLLCVALVIAQAAASRDPWAAPLGVAMCATFVLLAPISFLVLFREPSSLLHRLVLLGLYASIGVGAISVLGVAMPHWLHIGPTLLTERFNLLVC